MGEQFIALYNLTNYSNSATMTHNFIVEINTIVPSSFNKTTNKYISSYDGLITTPTEIGMPFNVAAYLNVSYNGKSFIIIF